MAKYICREYDDFDNTTFDYVVFADKASAKSYRRKWNSPGNVAVAVYVSYVCCPYGRINPSSLYFKRLERDTSAFTLREDNGKTRKYDW